MKNMHKNYRIGLDVGTNSLGWSLLLLDENGEPSKIEAAGSRIFTEGRDEKSQATLASTRRTARSARRRRDRFKQRQKFLLDVLTKYGLFPQDEATKSDLQKKNPLALRGRALQEKLTPYEIGRALFHLNQRRGFQSNRKDRSEEATSGKISESSRRLLEEMGLIEAPMSREDYKKLSRDDKKLARQQAASDRRNALEKLAARKNLTYGGFLYARQLREQPTRARPGAGDDGKLYDVYPTRELYKDEFKKIWAAQQSHHGDLMTAAARDRIDHVIFTQRPLKPQKVGMCAYMDDEERMFRAMPSFQRYRIFQEVNNLEWHTSDGKFKLLNYPDARDAIIALLMRPPHKEEPTDKNAQVGFFEMKKILKRMDVAEGKFHFNFETPKRKGFDGDLTAHMMHHEDYVGADWHDWPLEKQDEFVAVIMGDEMKDEEICEHLRRDYGLSHAAAEKCRDARFNDGTAALSLKAARLLLHEMKEGLMIQSDAVEKVADENENFINPFTRSRDGELQDNLPYYGEVFADGRHIIPGDRMAEDAGDARKYFGGVTNPTVHIALNQIRQVVNELITRYGRPAEIAIELGRNLPVGEKGRKEIDKEQRDNQDRNERLNKELHEQGQATTVNNRLRLVLWKELGAGPNDRRCPFSGDIIGVSDLFNGNAEIEHLIPFSRSLDDSRANKVICTRRANRDKGKATPFEAFGDDQKKGYVWDEIFERAKGLSKPKQWRFQKDAMEIWERDGDFTSRHLNDTRYIGRVAREYLECVCPTDKIVVLTGRLTALLRRHWGLNSVLHDDKNLDGEQPPKKKNREDHRHHAVDAIVIGMTSRAMLQKVSTAANRTEDLCLPAIFEKNHAGESAIDPWTGFRNEVRQVIQNIVVSHRSRRKKAEFKETPTGKRIPLSTSGQLHNETAYGIISGADKKGLSAVVVRKPVDWFDSESRLESIRNAYLRNKFMQAFKSGGDKADRKKQVAALAQELRIRGLRRTEKLKVIPITDKTGKEYKAYKGDSNWGMEIYEYPSGHKKSGKWAGIVISTFDANKHDFEPGQTYKPHPAAKLVMRLQINDCIEIKENDKKRIMRLQTISDRLSFAELYEANVDARNRNKEDAFNYYRKTASALKSVAARKVHISPAGKVNYEKRRKPRRKPDNES